MKFYQQGDVLIKEYDGDVSGKKEVHLTLAEGEATGHHHTITSGVAELYTSGEMMFLVVKSATAKLTHQEHGEIEIPLGKYKIEKVREYDHFLEEARRVVD